MKNARQVGPEEEALSYASPSPRLVRLLEQLQTYQMQIAEQSRQLADVRTKLRESYSRYDDLYDLSPVGYLTIDRKGRICEVNRKAANLLGFSPSWLVEKPFVVFVSKRDVSRFLALAMGRTAGHHNTIEIELTVNGGLLPVQISAARTSQDGTANHRMTLVDLSDIRRTEQELQESLTIWRSLVQNAPDVIMTLDRKGTVIFVNRPIWGRSAKTLIGASIFDYVPPEQRPELRRRLDQVFDSGERNTCDIARMTGKTERWYSFSFGPVESNLNRSNSSGESTTLIVREISEQKLAEADLRSSSKQLRDFSARLEAVREEERRRLSREIHDELGQALTALRLDLSWLESRTPRDQRQNRKKMASMVKHVDETIQRVRQIASELRPSILDDLGLVAAIEWQLAEFSKRTDIKCIFQGPKRNLEVDEERSIAFFRIAQEALTNVARHANPSMVEVRLDKLGSSLSMTVSDDGRGMVEFEMNSSTSLGLLGMKERVARLGGKFKIQSQAGKGTRLVVSVPLPKNK